MKYMKYSPFLVLLAMGVFSLGFASFADAHPHVTIELMETHSHDLYAAFHSCSGHCGHTC